VGNESSVASPPLLRRHEPEDSCRQLVRFRSPLAIRFPHRKHRKIVSCIARRVAFNSRRSIARRRCCRFKTCTVHVLPTSIPKHSIRSPPSPTIQTVLIVIGDKSHCGWWAPKRKRYTAQPVLRSPSYSICSRLAFLRGTMLSVTVPDGGCYGKGIRASSELVFLLIQRARRRRPSMSITINVRRWVRT
jgi:hypothetical protein